MRNDGLEITDPPRLPPSRVTYSKQESGENNGDPKYSILAHREGVGRPVRVGFNLTASQADALIARLEQRQAECLAVRDPRD